MFHKLPYLLIKRNTIYFTAVRSTRINCDDAVRIKWCKNRISAPFRTATINPRVSPRCVPMSTYDRFIRFNDSILTGEFHAIKPPCFIPLLFVCVSPIGILGIIPKRFGSLSACRNPTMTKNVGVCFKVVYTGRKQLLIVRGSHNTPDKLDWKRNRFLSGHFA